MRRIHRSRKRLGGVTLLEMVVAMVLLAIVVGATIFFANPIQQAGDVTVRAQLTDMADNALQRMGRDVRLALPNSVRVTTDVAGVAYLEFMPVRTGGRYRVESSGACSGGGTNELVFDASDGCFNALGTISNNADVVSGDLLVLSNYGTGFTNQNVYESGSTNKRSVTAASSTSVVMASGTFDRKLHDSPGRRFFIAGPPVTYRCDPVAGTLTRHTGYSLSATQPTSVGSGTALATSVSACVFDYTAGVAAHLGLLTLRLTLSKAVSTGTESISLYHALHINNLP
jgi:MSHA biogenesis protein MshO